MNYSNFNIKSTGVFYQVSKEAKDGFIVNNYTDKKSGEPRVNYHREVTSLSGKLHSIRLKETDYGEKLTISLTQANGDAHVLELPVFIGTTSNINDYTKSVSQYIENLVLGCETTIECNRTAKDKKDRLYSNIYFQQDGEKIQWAFPLFGADSPVPKGIEGVDKVTKKPKWDFSDQSVFIYDKLKAAVANLTAMGNAATQNTTATSDTPVSGTPAAAPDKAPVAKTNPDTSASDLGGAEEDLPF